MARLNPPDPAEIPPREDNGSVEDRQVGMEAAVQAGQQAADALKEQAIAYVRNGGKAPNRQETVQVLLAQEKAARAERHPITLAQLSGDWRLTFITGTKKSRQRAGVALGPGRFLPGWIKIAIAYQADDAKDADSAQSSDKRSDSPATNLPDEAEPTGWVENRVRFAGVDLIVAGPIQLYPQRRVLAFDFIKVRFALGGIKLFDGYVKGGEARQRAFAQKSMRDQAFFTYFWVTEDLIAARGRGGGLAIWVREQ